MNKINLAYCGFNSDGAATLYDVLRVANYSYTVNPLKPKHIKDCLETLILDGNNLNGNFKLLTEFLKKNTTIKKLSVRQCMLGQEGLHALFHGLRKNKLIRNIDVSENVFAEADEGYPIFGEFLIQAPHIWYFNACKNDIKNSGALTIAEALSHRTSLKALVLTDNGITQDGGEAIARALYNNKVIERLDLCSNSISVHVLNNIKERLTMNQEQEFSHLSPELKQKISNLWLQVKSIDIYQHEIETGIYEKKMEDAGILRAKKEFEVQKERN